MSASAIAADHRGSASAEQSHGQLHPPGGSFAMEREAGARTSACRERRFQLRSRIFAQAPAAWPEAAAVAETTVRSRRVTPAMAIGTTIGPRVCPPSRRRCRSLCAFQMRGFIEHPETEGVVHWLAVLVAQHHHERRRIEDERPLRVERDRRSLRRDDACRTIGREESDDQASSIKAAVQRGAGIVATCDVLSPVHRIQPSRSVTILAVSNSRVGMTFLSLAVLSDNRNHEGSFNVSMPEDTVPPFIEKVVHPTDLSPASERAFAHALAIALVRRARLIILHVAADDRPDWGEFPPCAKTSNAGICSGADSPRSALFERFGMRVTKRTIWALLPRAPSSITSTRLRPICWSLRPRGATAQRDGCTVRWPR